MWSAPAKNMKKITMSISFVYDVSIQAVSYTHLKCQASHSSAD